jgi:nicotinamidase-related amidase
MTQIPRTLLQIAGATPAPARLDEAVLIIIDAQEEYRSGIVPLEGLDAALHAIAALLAAARAAGAPVVHVVHRGKPGGVFDPATGRDAILPEVWPLPGEEIVDKALPSSFAHTILQESLLATGRRQLILCGFMTHMCLSTTARAALDLGYETTIAADATATRALPDPLGGPVISAAELHRTALAELADRFAIVTTVAGLI